MSPRRSFLLSCAFKLLLTAAAAAVTESVGGRVEQSLSGSTAAQVGRMGGPHSQACFTASQSGTNAEEKRSTSIAVAVAAAAACACAAAWAWSVADATVQVAWAV